jgi:hypothetical protein
VTAAAVLLAGLSLYGIMRSRSVTPNEIITGEAAGLLEPIYWFGPSSAPLPSLGLWFAVLIGLFIAHSLIVSGDVDRKVVASYTRYFYVAWKHGVQLFLALIFVVSFWLLLLLAMALFKLINVDFVEELIKKSWFSIPATVLAFTCAIHITDVHVGIVRGARTLGLTLLSWLLPMMALIATAFLITLLFTGLEPLWRTRSATVLLLLAAAALVILTNAAYQDGDPEHSVRIPRYFGGLAAVALVPLVGIAAYALSLRVGQYGWTPERVIAGACVVIAACYALGYAVAVVTGRPRLKRLEDTNVFAAFVTLAVLLALFTPIADPARISVPDQVARLESGKISPDQFDFAFLRFRSGRFGIEALEKLKAKQGGAEALRIADRAHTALQWTNRLDARGEPSVVSTPQQRAANIKVIYPKGASLPDSFLQQEDWPQRSPYPTCLRMNASPCEAMMLDLDGDGTPEVMVFAISDSFPAAAFKQSGNQWVLLGAVLNLGCKEVRDALRVGNFEIGAPELKELHVAGQSVQIRRECGG